jgi:hypothetical protein
MSELMRLKVPRGWAVLDNKFYDTDPIPGEAPDSFIENWDEGFIEDVMWIQEAIISDSGHFRLPETDHFNIDISWRPDSRMEGQYYASLAWSGNNELRNIALFESKDRFAIRDKIEFWMEDVKRNYNTYKDLPEVEW